MISSRIKVVAVALLVLTSTAGCMSTGPAPRSTTLPSAAVKARTAAWAQYFWQAHRTSCFFTVYQPRKVHGKLVRARALGTASIASSLPAPDGMSYVVARTDRTTVTTHGGGSRTTDHPIRILYTITDDGAVEIVPQTNLVTDARLRYTENYRYPALTEANVGRPVNETVHARAAPITQAEANAVSYVTTDGSPEIEFVATYRFTVNRPTRPVVTTAGTFSDVVALQATLVGLRVLNLSLPIAVKKFVASYRATALPRTVWYARGVGPVMVTETGAGGRVEKLVDCPTVSS